MLNTQRAIQRNNEFGNKRFQINVDTEIKMLTEEFEETVNALLAWKKETEEIATSISNGEPDRNNHLLLKTEGQMVNGVSINNILGSTEILDGIMDIMFVGIGTLHKIGFTDSHIEAAWNEVCDSNFTKFPVTRNADGKIMKSENFKRPDLGKIIRPLQTSTL